MGCIPPRDDLRDDYILSKTKITELETAPHMSEHEVCTEKAATKSTSMRYAIRETTVNILGENWRHNKGWKQQSRPFIITWLVECLLVCTCIYLRVICSPCAVGAWAEPLGWARASGETAYHWDITFRYSLIFCVVFSQARRGRMAKRCRFCGVIRCKPLPKKGRKGRGI